MSIEENISKALGIEVYDDKKAKVPVTIDQVPENKTEAEVDFDKVRSGNYDLRDQIGQAIQELLDIATRSQDHEAYTALSNLIKTAATLDKDLLEFHEKKKRVMNNVSDDKQNVTNNTLVLTTAELQKLLLEKKE